MKISEILITIAEIAVIILGIFVAYQILRKIFGGSWDSEDIILTIVTINATATFAIFTLTISMAKAIARLNSDLKHLSSDFRELKTDFKIHTEKFNGLATDFKLHLKDHKKH